MKEKQTSRLAFRIEQTLADKLIKYALSIDRSVSWVLRKLIKDKFNKEDK